MRIELFHKYYKDRAADISEFSVEIFKLKSFYKAPTNERTLRKTLTCIKY
jgi:hypothetical protein